MPNRIIKESIRTSKSVNALPDFLFRVWVYLITYVDDYGRGSADPQLLRGLVFPRGRKLGEEKLAEALADLADRGLIRLYEAEGEPYFCFPKWDEHQRIRAKKSKFPPPDDSGQQTTADDDKCVRNPIQSNPNPESESESKDSAELQSTAALTLLLNDGTEYPVTQEYVQEMQALYPAVDVMQELRTMKAWCINNPKKRKTARGIRSFMGTWLAKEQDRGARNAGADAEPARKPKQFTTAAEYRPEAKIDAEQLEKVKSLLLGNGAEGPDPGEG